VVQKRVSLAAVPIHRSRATPVGSPNLIDAAGAGLHDQRRLNATVLVVEVIDVTTAQTRLGHADPRTTPAVYARAPASIDRGRS
jgi:hypothetical protein